MVGLKSAPIWMAPGHGHYGDRTWMNTLTLVTPLNICHKTVFGELEDEAEDCLHIQFLRDEEEEEYDEPMNDHDQYIRDDDFASDYDSVIVQLN